MLSIAKLRKHKLFFFGLILLCISLATRLYDWTERAQNFYGDKARDIFISALIADGQSLSMGHGASGLVNPPIHYPSYYYQFLSLFWVIAQDPFDFLFLLAILHAIWVLVFVFVSYKIKKNFYFPLLIGLWYTISFLWVDFVYEVVGVRVASPLFLLWLLFWLWFEETKKRKFLIFSGITAAVITLFHYSIVPAVLSQIAVIFLFNIKDLKLAVYRAVNLSFSFILPFLIFHISQIQFYGLNNVIHSWIKSGEEVTFTEFTFQVIVILKDQLSLLLLPNPSTVIAASIILFFSFFAIFWGKFSKKLLLFVVIFMLLAATRKQYFEPYFTPGRIALSLFIVISFWETLHIFKSKVIRSLVVVLFILYAYLSSSFLSVLTWKSREMSNIRELTAIIATTLKDSEYQVHAFDEDSLGWDTSMIALWLWFDHQKDWFRTVNHYYNFEYKTSRDVTILVCTRKSGKPCDELWVEFLKNNSYLSFKWQVPIKIMNSDALLVCKQDCPEILHKLESVAGKNQI